MKIKILSHACMLIESEGTRIIVDPWLVGSCYWRSWWNYPKAVINEFELSLVDAVVITHVHWDHWHGATLRRYFQNKPVITVAEPNRRSARDLRALGFSDVRFAKHGKTIRFGSLNLTFYQFGLFLNDAALVVDDGVNRLLNANDAKIAGGALAHLCRRHAPFTFAFRSHSSANPRVCFKVLESSNYELDDRDHYFRSFKLFMTVVRPQFAVPFASNHCHLHDETFHLNSYISNPVQLKRYLDLDPLPTGVLFREMAPGAAWSSTEGFKAETVDHYERLNDKLLDYRHEVTPILERYRVQEDRAKLGMTAWNRMMTLLRRVPKWLRPYGRVAISARWPDGRSETVEIDVRQCTYTLKTSGSYPRSGVPLMVFPAIVLRDAIYKNMFHHAGISKRCEFISVSINDHFRLKSMFSLLERIELGVYPIRLRYLGDLVCAYALRWRELWVYLQASWFLYIERLPIYIAEEKILQRTMRFKR